MSSDNHRDHIGGCGTTGKMGTVANCKMDCACWCHQSNTQREAGHTETLHHEMNCAAWHNAAGFEVNEEDCTCGYRWRVEIQDLQTLKAAWEKRAYQSEDECKALVKALRLALPLLKEDREALVDCHSLRDANGTRFLPSNEQGEIDAVLAYDEAIAVAADALKLAGE